MLSELWLGASQKKNQACTRSVRRPYRNRNQWGTKSACCWDSLRLGRFVGKDDRCLFLSRPCLALCVNVEYCREAPGGGLDSTDTYFLISLKIPLIAPEAYASVSMLALRHKRDRLQAIASSSICTCKCLSRYMASSPCGSVAVVYPKKLLSPVTRDSFRRGR